MSESLPIHPSKFYRVQVALGTLLLLVGIFLPGLAHAVPCLTAPTLSLDSAGKYSAEGEYVDYVVTVTNLDGGSCDFIVSSAGDDANFSSAIQQAPPLTVGPGADGTVTLRVSVTGGTADWTTHVTTVSTDAIASGSINATTTVFDNDPLLHNSVNLNSAKHSGNWGSTKAGSKYGSITCATCHTKTTTNIKRIRTSITTPDNTFGSFPGDGQTITFLSAEDGTADMGDDTGGHGTSDRICETCHTYSAAGTNGVKFHAYSMAGDPGHYNGADCISCHKHKTGFKASCSSCHGGGTVGSATANYWPDASTGNAENDTPGLHLTHMNILAQRFGETASSILDTGAAVSQTDLCGYCHDTPGGDGDHASATTAETAFHPIWNKAAAASGSYSTADGNCTNSCHNSKATGVGTYGWLDSGGSQCIMCHNDMTTTGNTTGETHDDHLTASTNFGRTITCDDCHDAATNWGTNTPPASNHIDGDFDLGGVVTLTYTGSTPPGTSYGGCGTNACHNDGQGGVPANAGYQWDDDGLGDCTICHPGLPTSDSHPTHVNTAEDKYAGGSNPSWTAINTTATDYDFGCGTCHGSTLGAHLNGSATVAGVNYNNPGAGQCSTNACHHDGQGGAPNLDPTWGTAFTPGACNQCHGNIPTTAAHPQHVLEVGFHYDAIYSGLTDFLPVVDGDDSSVDQGLDDGDGNPSEVSAANPGYDQLRGHGGNLLSGGTPTSTVVSCNVCHSEVITTNFNDLGSYSDANPKTKACDECHDDTITPKLGIVAVADKQLHVNGTINVRFFDEKVRSKAQVRDEKTYVVDGDGETNWTKTTELTNNWVRFNGYKNIDGSSYDEQPDTLHNMTTTYNGGDSDYYNTTDKTCMISCHLWEAGRVDKVPVHWVDNATGGSTPLMCIDCHSRLPK